MKAAIVIIAIVMVLIIFGPMVTGIKDARTDNRTDTIACTTGDATNGTVVLVGSLFNSAISEVSDITSNMSSDVPNPESYASTTRTLTVSGLTKNATRSLTVNYATAGLSDYTGADTFLKLVPLLIAAAIGIIAIAQAVGAFKR